LSEGGGGGQHGERPRLRWLGLRNRSKDGAGTLHVFAPDFPSYDFVAPMLSSIVRDLNADGTPKATAVP